MGDRENLNARAFIQIDDQVGKVRYAIGPGSVQVGSELLGGDCDLLDPSIQPRYELLGLEEAPFSAPAPSRASLLGRKRMDVKVHRVHRFHP